MKPLVRFLLIVVGTGLYAGLSVLSGGGPSAFFSHPALIALMVVLAIMAVASFFVGGNLSAGVREDRRNRWVLTAFAVIGLLSTILPPYTDWKEIWTFGGDQIRWLGVILFTVGGLLRLWPVYVLGNRFSGLVAIQSGHTLVTDGIYRIIRHPSYLGFLINSLGWSLTFRSILGVLLTLIMLVPLVARIRAEERLLRSQFGDQYDAYCARTSRLIPGLY